jgi:hypothetical protein
MSISAKIGQIADAIEKADRLESKLVFPATDVPSFTSMKIRHLLNNLGAYTTNYLECGTHKGGHFCSVVYGNNIEHALAFDDYSEFYVNGETKEECMQNLKKYTPDVTKWALIEEDCFRSDYIKDFYPELKFDLFNYDAQHTESAQQRAVTHFVDNLADVFIMVVDDWTFNGVETGTRMGIQLAKLNILYQWAGFTPEGEPHNDHWHNGYAVFLLQKPTT